MRQSPDLSTHIVGKLAKPQDGDALTGPDLMRRLLPTKVSYNP